MEWESFTTDQLEQVLVESHRAQDRLQGQDLEVHEELDRRQTATADGCKSLSEWLAARLDLSLGTARRLVRTMRRTAQRVDLRELLASGEVSFDRVHALSRISEDVGLLRNLDVAGVQTEAAKRIRITAEDESRSADDQFLVLQPSLDESWWRGWFGLDGHSGALVDKVLTETADQLPALPDGSRGDSSWRKPTHWSNCVSLMTRHRLRSPYSLTPTRPPKPTAKQVWCWKLVLGWVVRPWRPSFVTPLWR